MDYQAFWGLLDRRGSHEDCDALAAALQTELETRPVDEIADFCHTFDACMDALYTWELWAAAYIMNGGCSDDGFEYFRCWVIAQGREAFEVARTDPERFGLSIDPGTEDLECEALLYAGHSAYKSVTGEYGPARSVPHPRSPSGRSWPEDAVSEVFPRLWTQWTRS